MDDDIKTTAEVAEADALRLGRAVHSDPSEPPSPEQQPLPKGVAKKPVNKKSPAEWAYERLILYIKNFEAQLEGDEEVAMGFTDSGVGVIKIEGMGYFDPDIVTFYGTDASGARTQLVQHVSQLNVLLRSVPKPQEADAPRRIGFKLSQGFDDS
ncbi:MAG: DUF6173 family protein [Pseudomonadota bacterium]